MVAKGLFCGRVAKAPHPSNDDEMIACFNTIMKFAIQPGGGIGKYRASRYARHPPRVCKFVGRLRSECPGDVLLTFGKDVDSEMGRTGRVTARNAGIAALETGRSAELHRDGDFRLSALLQRGAVGYVGTRVDWARSSTLTTNRVLGR